MGAAPRGFKHRGTAADSPPDQSRPSAAWREVTRITSESSDQGRLLNPFMPNHEGLQAGVKVASDQTN
jgi:hypothetical protein